MSINSDTKREFIADLAETFMKYKNQNVIMYQQEENSDVRFKDKYQDEFNHLVGIIEEQFDKNFKDGKDNS